MAEIGNVTVRVGAVITDELREWAHGFNVRGRASGRHGSEGAARFPDLPRQQGAVRPVRMGSGMRASNVERIAYCSMCKHSAPRHRDAHHKKSRYRLVCLMCAVAVTERGIPLSLYAERYPCGYGGKAPEGGWLPLSFERKEAIDQYDWSTDEA